jgi:hypothetical protein
MAATTIRALLQDLAEELDDNDYLEEDAEDAKRISAILSAATRCD